MNKIILALTFLIIALVGAGAVAAACDANNATADNLKENVIDAPVVDTLHTSDAIAVENDSGDVCVNDSCGDLKSIDGQANVALQERPSTDVHLGKMVNMTPVKIVKTKAASKQPLVKVSKNTLSSIKSLYGSHTMKICYLICQINISIKSLYGSHTLESIGMAIGLTPAQTKNMIKDMKAGKHRSTYKKSIA